MAKTGIMLCRSRAGAILIPLHAEKVYGTNKEHLFVGWWRNLPEFLYVGIRYPMEKEIQYFHVDIIRYNVRDVVQLYTYLVLCSKTGLC